MLESLLPSKFQQKIKEVKILEQSEILEEVKFHASFEVNICTKEDPEELFFYIASKNCTEMKARRKEKMRIGFSSNRFNPGRRIRDQRSAKDSTEEKRYGQGGRKGEERQLWSRFHIQTISLCMGMRRRRKEMEITSICPSVSDDDDLMTRRLWYILWFLRAATAISLMPRDLLTSATTRYKIREAWECL